MIPILVIVATMSQSCSYHQLRAKPSATCGSVIASVHADPQEKYRLEVGLERLMFLSYSLSYQQWNSHIYEKTLLWIECGLGNDSVCSICTKVLSS